MKKSILLTFITATLLTSQLANSAEDISAYTEKMEGADIKAIFKTYTEANNFRANNLNDSTVISGSNQAIIDIGETKVSNISSSYKETLDLNLEKKMLKNIKEAVDNVPVFTPADYTQSKSGDCIPPYIGAQTVCVLATTEWNCAITGANGIGNMEYGWLYIENGYWKIYLKKNEWAGRFYWACYK